MAKVKNTMELIKRAEQCENNRYTIRFNNVCDIRKASSGEYDLISNSFYFGYMQGMKAAKAEMRKVH